MIEDGYKHNFGLLIQAVKNGDVCLVECKDVKTGIPVVTVCAVQTISSEAAGKDGDLRSRDDDELQVVPLAKLFDGDPYEELIPPTAFE